MCLGFGFPRHSCPRGHHPSVPLTGAELLSRFASPFLCLTLQSQPVFLHQLASEGGLTGAQGCPLGPRTLSPPHTTAAGNRSPGSGPPSWPPGPTCERRHSPHPVWGSRGCEIQGRSAGLAASWQDREDRVARGSGRGLAQALTFFRATNSFSAVARRATSSSYLRGMEKTGPLLSNSQLGHEACKQTSLS